MTALGELCELRGWPSLSTSSHGYCQGDYAESPVIYSRAASYGHATLKAAARRLASLIARQGRRGYAGERFDSLYIVTPEGERLPLRAARERIAANAI